MTNAECSRETEVLAAAAADQFTDELRTHIVECSECTELVMVARFMSRGAEQLGGIGPIPDAGYLWWRAHLERREHQSRRAVSVINLIQKATLVAGVIIAVTLLRSSAPAVGKWLVTTASTVQSAAASGDMASPMLVVVVCLGLLAAPSVFNLYGTWSRD